MIEKLEIRPDGEVRGGGLSIGTIAFTDFSSKWDAPGNYEPEGWSTSDADALSEAEAQIDAWSRNFEKLELIIQEALDDDRTPEWLVKVLADAQDLTP